MPMTRLSLLPLEFVVFAGGLALGYYTPHRLRFIYALAQLATIVAIDLLVPGLQGERLRLEHPAVEFFVVSDPYEEYYRVGDRKKDDDAKAAMDLGRPLQPARRGLELGHRPDAEGRSRGRVAPAAAMYVLQDIGRISLLLSPYVRGLQGTPERDLPFFERMWTTVALGLTTFMQAETVQ